jgi:hypothetical protein
MDPVTMIQEFLNNIEIWWESSTQFLDSFAQFGLEPAADSIDRWGRRETSITTKVLGIVYVAAKMLPGTLIVLIALREYFGDLRRATAGAIAFQSFSIILQSYILNIKPGPGERYQIVAYGPNALFSAIKSHFTNDPIGAVTTWIVVMGVFFILSYLMWYFINFLLWFVTLTFRRDPLFSDASAKGHALWMTITWFFYLTIDDPGTAFVNTIIVLGIMLGNRAWQDRKRRGPPDIDEGDPVTVIAANEEPEIEEETVEETEDQSSDKIVWE